MGFVVQISSVRSRFGSGSMHFGGWKVYGYLGFEARGFQARFSKDRRNIWALSSLTG